MIPHEQQLDMLERLAGEAIPVARRSVPTRLWTEEDPYGGRPAVNGRVVTDAAGQVESSRNKPGEPTLTA